MPNQNILGATLSGCDCSGCVAERARWADEREDDTDTDDYDDGCGDCGYMDCDECNPSTDIIHYHDYRPDPIFHGDGPLYLGMELEVEAARYTRADDAEYLQSAMGELVYLKEDGSIDYGFEIVTHPMSYSWAMENFPWEVLSALKSRGCSVNRRVGIHVHVSRAAFGGESHMYRWMKFVYRNAPQVRRLARRNSTEWASFDPYYRAQVKDYVKGGKGDRYQAINPNNTDTLEVRVFASSLKPNEVKAALAFVAATVEYTRGLDSQKIIQGRGWAWDAFVEWLRVHDEYAPLLTELEALECVS
jgi:hypothetical protein